MSEQAVYLLGYYARVQTEIELLVQLRLRSLPDVRAGLGPGYFEQMSDATRKRWLKALASDEEARLGERLESCFAQVAEVRNHIAHAPMNIHGNGDENPDDIRIGSARWLDKPMPTEAEIGKAQERLLWIESWVIWLLTQLEAVEPFQKREGEWQEFRPERPRRTLLRPRAA